MVNETMQKDVRPQMPNEFSAEIYGADIVACNNYTFERIKKTPPQHGDIAIRGQHFKPAQQISF